MTLDRIRIVSIRAIARETGMNHLKIWRLFKWYVSIYGDDPRYVIIDADGRKRPTEEFLKFLKRIGVL